jgi:hypothetical protein
MSLRHTPRAALATITAVVALAAPAVLDPGMFEHESLKDGPRAAEVSAAISRPFWPAAFEQVLAAAPVQEHAGT